MIDPTDDGITLPLEVTSPCTHVLKFASPNGLYVAQLDQDLLGDWFVLQSHGQRKRVVSGVEEGVALLATLARRLEKQGYVAIE